MVFAFERVTRSKKIEIRFRAATMRMLLDVLGACRSVVSIAVLTGMIIGEILALRRKRVDLLRSTIEVAETYSAGGVGPPKPREVVARSRLVRLFARYLRIIAFAADRRELTISSSKLLLARP